MSFFNTKFMGDKNKECCVKLKCIKFNGFFDKNDIKYECINLANFTLEYYFESSTIMSLLIRRMNDPCTEYIYYAPSLLYNPFTNIGIIHKYNEPTQLFRISNIIQGDEFAIYLESININDPTKKTVDDLRYKKHSFSYYYHSPTIYDSDGDDICNGQEGGREYVFRTYLSRYGTMPNKFQTIFEPLVRLALDCKHDQNKFKYNQYYDGEYLYTSDDSAWTSNDYSSDDSYDW